MARICLCLLVGGALLACSESLRAEERLVQRVYPVADLIVPGGNTLFPAICQGLSRAPDEGALIWIVTASVDPKTWIGAGGRGTADYFPLTMALVVNQTEAVHAQIASLLKSLRTGAT